MKLLPGPNLWVFSLREKPVVLETLKSLGYVREKGKESREKGRLTSKKRRDVGEVFSPDGEVCVSQTLVGEGVFCLDSSSVPREHVLVVTGALLKEWGERCLKNE